MRNIRLTIEYNGKEFGGWQKQPKKLNIQGEIERAIKEITGEEVELIASGRTDAKVHSLGQMANFKTNSKIPIEKFEPALNSKLKQTIRILKAEEVEEDFHCRYNCKKKTYRYVINKSTCSSAIMKDFEYFEPRKLNIKEMKKAIKYFEGEHDFKAFKASGTSSKTSVRKIFETKIIETNDIIKELKDNKKTKDLNKIIPPNRIYIEITGSGFLYNMIRIIAGTLLEVGYGNIKAEDIPKIIEKGKREEAGKTLPPQGLFLIDVKY